MGVVVGGGRNKAVVLVAMILAVSTIFAGKTIMSTAAPEIQHDLGLSTTGIQWAVNGYLLALAALFVWGGRLGDVVGHGKMVVLGIVVFTAASVMCALTPHGGIAEGWIIGFRILQGAGGAITVPAAVAIIVHTFPLHERGRPLALFFGIAGGLVALGPVLGAILTEWTWRVVFWVNVPVALVTLVLIFVSKPVTPRRAAPNDFRGLVLIVAGIGLSVFGFQQSELWGWESPATWLCITGGLALLVVFAIVEGKVPSPLIEMKIFRVKAFFVENVVLFTSMIAFIPLFFFVGQYAQVSLAESALRAGLFPLLFFVGFIVTSQVGGRMLDRSGAKLPVVLGSVAASVGYVLWAGSVVTLQLGVQDWYVVLTGAGMGLMLGPANSDAINQSGELSYGEATGVTQTVRNYAASLGLAILGPIFIVVDRSRLTASLIGTGLSRGSAAALATGISDGVTPFRRVQPILPTVRLDFAYATRAVLYVMAAVMAATALIALVGLERGQRTGTGGGEIVKDAAGVD